MRLSWRRRLARRLASVMRMPRARMNRALRSERGTGQQGGQGAREMAHKQKQSACHYPVVLREHRHSHQLRLSFALVRWSQMP